MAGSIMKRRAKYPPHATQYMGSLRLRESNIPIETQAGVRACGKTVVLPVNGREVPVTDYEIVNLLKNPRARNPGKARLGNLRMRISKGEELPLEERHIITRLIESIDAGYFKNK